MIPHLDAAYNLARWLLRSEADAEDVVQESYLRAFRFFDTFRGENSRSWMLTIVRNTCYSWIQRQQPQHAADEFNEESYKTETIPDPERILERLQDEELLREALNKLQPEFREVIVLRELEGYSYKEIADLADIPLGTVMSRLARGRKMLCELVLNQGHKS